MTKKELKAELKLIQKGLKEFPKVLAEKETAFKHKEKMMRNFASISKDLFKKEKNKAKKTSHS